LYYQAVKHLIITILTVAAFLTGCSGKQDAIVKAYNSMASAEQAYVTLYKSALQTENFQGIKTACNTYLRDVQGIDTSDCPDDFKLAMKSLESSLNDINVYLSGINNIDNVDDTRFEALTDARLNATEYVGSVAESHGLTLIR
jgi:hypothetical protein